MVSGRSSAAPQSKRTPSHSAEAAAKASRRASFSTCSSASPTKAWISSARASRLRDAARLEIEQQILVDLAGGRAVAADHVVGENLKLGLGIELGRLRQQQRLRHLLAVGLLRAGRNDDLALEHAARLVVEHGLEQLAAGAMRARDARPGASCRNAAGRASETRRRYRAPSLRRRIAHRSGCGRARRRSRTGRRRSGRRSPSSTSQVERWSASCPSRWSLTWSMRRLVADQYLGHGVALERRSVRGCRSSRSPWPSCPASATTTLRVTVEAGSPLPSSWMRWIGLSSVTPCRAARRRRRSSARC